MSDKLKFKDNEQSAEAETLSVIEPLVKVLDVESMPEADTTASKTIAPVKSKLYKRKSSLKLTKSKDDKKYIVSKKKSVKKQRRVFGVTGDTTTNSPIPESKALVPIISAATAIVPTKTVNTAVAPAVIPAKTGLISGKRTEPKSRLKFAKQDEKILKLARKHDKYSHRLEKAREKLPTKTTKVEQRFYTKKKGKNGKPEIKLRETKIRFDKEVIPFEKAEWNQPKKQSPLEKGAAAVTAIGINKLHYKIHQAEHENVGVKAAHKAELMGESAFREGKKIVKSAYRFHKNTPYRKVAKLEQKTLKTGMKLDYNKALRDNPKLKSNAMSRFMQKRQIKRKYAVALRKAKQSGQTLKTTGRILNKTRQIMTNIVRRNPVFLMKLGFLLLILFLVMSLFGMCMSIFSGGTGIFGAVMYTADYEDIDMASVLYTELETDLRIYLLDVEENHPDFDEYRFNIGTIRHNPLELMAFLTAVYGEFTFSEVEATIRQIFEHHYTLELVPEIEIRQRWEQVGWELVFVGFDAMGFPIWEWIPVYGWVSYEWHILNVTLTVISFTEVLLLLMDEEQTQHYEILMFSRGARQFVGNPFDFDWLPNVTSLYGYRVHPISGGKQFHWGIDIGLPTGTPILAGLDGVVVAVGYDPNGYGNFVVIESDDGVQARYAHCHDVFVSMGQVVWRGEVIATVGSTGASTGPHLHIEIARGGIRINPIFFVDFN